MPGRYHPRRADNRDHTVDGMHQLTFGMLMRSNYVAMPVVTGE